MRNSINKIHQFKEIYLQIYGIDLTDIQATELSNQVLELVKISLINIA